MEFRFSVTPQIVFISAGPVDIVLKGKSTSCQQKVSKSNNECYHLVCIGKSNKTGCQKKKNQLW